MAALTGDRMAMQKRGDYRSVPVAAGVKLYVGALGMVNAAGMAVQGQTALGLTALGASMRQYDNTLGAAGAIRAVFRRGIHNFANSAGADAITEANIGQTAYVVDDQTVALTSGTNTRSPAGRIYEVDADGVWVEIL